MNFKNLSSFHSHFHIRWSTGSKLSWYAFKTHAEAEAIARRFASPHESYRIVERNGSCERCASFWCEKWAA